MMLRKVPASRPALSRVRDLLQDIVAKPQQGSNLDPLVALAQTAARIADDEQKAQARRQAENEATIARAQLASGAFSILKDNIERLWGKIHREAPNAIRKPSTNALECRLGHAHLHIDLPQRESLASGLFGQSRWDVVCMAQINVLQENPRYIWSASLWYMKAPEHSEYRWQEVSFWDWQGNAYQPYAISDVRAADVAASHVMTRTNIAFGPIPIDDEREDEFHSRWVWLLAKAAEGRIRYPRTLPIQEWPPGFA